MKKAIYLSILLFSTSLAVQAGGWLKGKGNGFFKLGQTVIRGDQFFDGDGEVTDIFTTGVYITSLYGEYGISDRFDVIAYVPFTRVTVNDVRFTSGNFQEGDEFNSIGDADISLKYGIIRDKALVLSASVTLGLPLGNTEGGRTNALQTGDGEFNQMIRLEAGYGFQNAPMYANAGIAFNNRTKDFSEEFRFDAEFGYKLNEKLLVALKISSIESFMNGNPEGSMNGIFSNNLEFFSFGPEVAYQIKKNWGVSAGIKGASSGQFIIAAPSIEAGVYLDLKK